MTAARPAPGAARPYEFPFVHRAVLANGVRVLVAPMPRLPIVTVVALLDAGAVTEPAGQEGVAMLTARLLTEGADGLDGATLAARLEGLGTSIEAEAEWDSSAAQFTATTSRLDAAFALFATVVRAPDFPAREVARLREERLAEISHQLAEPRGLADERFDGFLYDPRARYARAAEGTRRSVEGLGREEVRAFHANAYTPRNCSLVFVGDVTPEQAQALAERRFGSWVAAEGSAPRIAVADRPRAGGRRAVLVEKAGAPQTELRLGHVGVPRLHPDHFPIVVMNAILGGLFSSRINLNLREKHAFTYGASSAFDWRRGAGPFVVSTAVKSDVTGRAVAEVLAEIRAMRETAPSPGEVELATEYLAGVFPIRYESTAAVAAALARAALLGLGDDWFTHYRARMRGVSTAQVLDAARTHLDPDRLLVLAVGDAAVIEPQITAANVGMVSRVASETDPAEGVAP